MDLISPVRKLWPMGLYPTTLIHACSRVEGRGRAATNVHVGAAHFETLTIVLASHQEILCFGERWD